MEVFSNLKLLVASYPAYYYNTLNNYLSKSKTAYENEKVRIERKTVHRAAIPQRRIQMVGKRVNRKTQHEEIADKKYWLSKPAIEHPDAVATLRSQFIKKGLRMDRAYGGKIKFQ